MINEGNKPKRFDLSYESDGKMTKKNEKDTEKTKANMFFNTTQNSE